METPMANQDETFELLERLSVEHAALERRLNELDTYHSLTREEELERAQVKKLKLQKKDQIAWLSRKTGLA
ncbi:MAG: DUF465 domain-containing protein [Deltaproteobacteria bacterium]|nr:DUF465 domain-containing protein [Deltaproteobacteria bacterium]